ncbi:winged helix domain-containing protein [Xanthobacter flavus]|uniref:winged helix domain-containing protein n=1 Tax=Xanthobacter flavus TaxID=281 RepID=UPI00372C0A06
MADVTFMRVRVGGPDGQLVTLRGRVAWTLSHLIDAGERGCTPIERPAPRWSDYVFKLRKVGILVETIHEGHHGAYAGHHGRYVLRTEIEVVERAFAGGEVAA